jgi:hypothetical protein
MGRPENRNGPGSIAKAIEVRDCKDQFFALSTSLFLAITRGPQGKARGRARQ